jgi:hypothetical protein
LKALATALALAIAAVAPAAKFTTQRFDVTLTIQPNGTLNVREEIAVTFTEPQRGLLRRLPAITRGRDDLVRRSQYQLLGVQADRGDGFAATPATSEALGGDWQIRIGRRDVLLNGPVTYRIDYKVLGAMTPFAGGDALGRRTELLWNVFPTNWPTVVPNGKVILAFPKPQPGILRARVLVGDLGTRQGLELEPGRQIGNRKVVAAEMSRTALHARLVQPLRPGQTMTIALALPGETVRPPAPEIEKQTPAPKPIVIPAEPPSLGARLAKATKPHAFNPVEGGAFVLPLLLIIPVWLWRQNRHFSEGPLVVQFDPPVGVGPSECGLILDRSVDSRDIVAGMLSLAQKGAATVRPHAVDRRTFTLSLKGMAHGRDLTEFEQTLYRVLETYGPNIDAATLRGRFGNDYRRLSVALLQTVHDRGLTATPGMTGQGCAMGCLFGAVILGVGVWLSVWISPLAMVGALFACLVTAIFVGTMSNLTEAGVRVRAHVRGLREFIRRADSDELSRMSETMPAQALYERLLPYAVAFGYVEQWAHAFRGMEIAPPDWFQAPYGGDTWTIYQISDLLVQEHAWSEAITLPPPIEAPSDKSFWTSGATSSFDSGTTFSSGDSGFSGSSDFGSSYDSSSGSFDSGASSGDGGGGGGGDSW